METYKLINPNPSDIIRVKINNSYYHYGIYISDSQVVEFGHPFSMYQDHNDIKVIISSIDEFVGNNFLEVRVYSKEELKKKRSKEEIITLALNSVGQGGYNLFNNNCEHFVNYIVFGEKRSSQIDSVRNEIKKKLKKEN